jgi:hypothetical protein
MPRDPRDPDWKLAVGFSLWLGFMLLSLFYIVCL